MRKITRLRLFVVLLIALIFHIAFLNNLKIFGSKPDLMLILIVFFGLFFGSGAGLEAGLVAGFMKDIFAMDFFWINTFILALSGFLAGELGDKFSRESRLTQFILVFSFTVFSMMLHYIFASAFSKSCALGFGEYLASSIVPDGIYTSLLALPVFSKLIDIYDLKELEDLL